eukprot:COSAG01_NODE_22462_length_854_cov_39.850331_2_plen_109_part_01
MRLANHTPSTQHTETASAAVASVNCDNYDDVDNDNRDGIASGTGGRSGCSTGGRKCGSASTNCIDNSQYCEDKAPLVLRNPPTSASRGTRATGSRVTVVDCIACTRAGW